MEQPERNFVSTRRRPRPGLIALIVLLHLAALYGLTRAFAPTFVASVEETVVSAITVTITTPEEPEPEPDAGAAGEEGRKQACTKRVGMNGWEDGDMCGCGPGDVQRGCSTVQYSIVQYNTGGCFEPLHCRQPNALQAAECTAGSWSLCTQLRPAQHN